MWQFGFSEDRTWDDESIVSSNFDDCRTCRGAGALGRPRAFNNKGVMDEYRRPKQGYEAVKAIFNAFWQKEA